MSQGLIVCPKCRQPMQEGYFTDNAQFAQWHEGRPKRWLGMHMTGWSKRRIQITAYRCTSCGYLESYAK
jgi:hypothetical protein